jgi:tRNA-(ms[2]io[6]A)-hydroxylase
MDISHIKNFLGCETPIAWCEQAATEQTTLLIDHAHCEKKAASTAITMLFRYAEQADLIYQLSRIAREELRHFERVLAILKKRHIPFKHIEPARYAEGLRQSVTTHEPNRLIDLLIISAFIEARSCERFSKIIPYLDNELGSFYASLLTSEARHYEIYLGFANQIAKQDLTERINHFREIEKKLILTPDPQLRFHSGIPTIIT